MSQSSNRDDKLNEEQLGKLLRQAGARPVPPEALAKDVKSAVYDVWQEEVARSRKVRRSRWMAIAASVALVISIGIFQLESELPENVASVDNVMNRVEFNTGDSWEIVTDESSLNRSSSIRTGDNAYLSITLASGMNVRVDENSEVQLSGIHQISLEKGRVYIDSYARSADDNFVVKTLYGQATDIGTQFAVATAEDGWIIQVREGLVVVQDEGIEKSIGEGGRISISAADEYTTSTVNSTDSSWQWAENVLPTFDIEGKSLDAYLIWFSRETGTEVTFRSELARSAAASTMLSGSIDGFKPGESLEIVLSATDFELIDKNDDSVLIGK
jgi:hypothetical protein